ncbi:CAAX prenyl protease 2 isoform X1 [Andrographis paniculata]|uniref:CAAX prenyl protease 2 isoform X1 n=1 Tax=Andrographis paniculata TaxID=175694 RepID=UPI0021E9661C|nr:CAAX prenyl protease 2 isoform X1 [Andrographis paniculata]
MELLQEDGGGGLTKLAAVASCIAMAVLYVGILYAPTLILRLPPPDSFKSFMMRRFACAAISSVVSLLFCSLILPMNRAEALDLFGVYGVRIDHIWEAMVYPLSLTSLMYAGSFVLRLLSIIQESTECLNDDGSLYLVYVKNTFMDFIEWLVSVSSSVSAWRNYVVAPLTEELVFRACMIPLLLCGGFSAYTVILLCPIFFSLAHLNHFFEVYLQQKGNLLKACAIIGFQLGYTVIFGAFASFLFIRTVRLRIVNFRSPSITADSSYILQFHGLACNIFPSIWDGKCGIHNGDGRVLVDALSADESTFVQQQNRQLQVLAQIL